MWRRAWIFLGIVDIVVGGGVEVWGVEVGSDIIIISAKEFREEACTSWR